MQLIEAISAEQRDGSASEPGDGVKPQAVPVAVVVACVASVGYSMYTGYKSGDPVEFIAGAIIGCIPGGAAAKPAVVKLIKANKGAIIKALKALGVSGALIAALEGDSSK